MKIAVLIPVYNCAPYLRECLDSVLGQDVPGLEVRCLDDGSTDDSRDILAAYAAKHGNVRYGVQENAGVSVTRNRLLDGLSAEVEAFAFLDADDSVAPGMYAKLAEALERTGADVAECEWDGAERVIDDLSVFVLRQTAPGRWINVINKLYRPRAVGTIRFRKGLSFEEDFFFNYEVHAGLRRKVLVPGSFYFYRKNPQSATSALDQRRYFSSAAERVRLSLSEFLAAGRIPPHLEARFREELSKDVCRMCLRKNLKNNGDVRSRRALFAEAGTFLSELERRWHFAPVGLNPIQNGLWRTCRSGHYRLARALTFLT